MKLHLVDGTYELFRAFFGAPSARAPDGREVGATLGLLRSLIGLLQDPQVTHVACAFDTVIESFRNDLFAGYKTGDGIEPDLFAQFPLAEIGSRALGVVTWSMLEFEADDALATAAARFAEAPDVEQVVLCSPDKDLAQCVRGSKVVLWDRLRRKVYDEAGVIAKFGIPPDSIPDYLALVGDTADGIPGIPRWGAKSASRLLARYGSLDAIPRAHTDWDVAVRGAEALAFELTERRQKAALYRTLTTLRLDVPLGETLDDLAWRGPHRPALEAFCLSLGDTSIPSRVPSR